MIPIQRISHVTFQFLLVVLAIQCTSASLRAQSPVARSLTGLPDGFTAESRTSDLVLGSQVLCSGTEPRPFGSVAPPTSPARTTSIQSAPIQFAPPVQQCIPQTHTNSDTWTKQMLPDGLIYRSYLAGPKEPRLGTSILYDSKREGWVWDSTVGARVGIFRFGDNQNFNGQGWQFDIEGAAMPRLDLLEQQDVESVDYRFGALITYANGPAAFKFGYFHVSSHVGDEFLVRNPGFTRLNYVSESIILGTSVQVSDELRVYGEVSYAPVTDGGAEPWQLQYGAEYVPIPKTPGKRVPYIAANVHLREEVDGGNINVMGGWLWRNPNSSRTVRTGFQYFYGHTNQFEFLQTRENMFGLGMWYDF